MAVSIKGQDTAKCLNSSPPEEKACMSLSYVFKNSLAYSINRVNVFHNQDILYNICNETVQWNIEESSTLLILHGQLTESSDDNTKPKLKCPIIVNGLIKIVHAITVTNIHFVNTFVYLKNSVDIHFTNITFTNFVLKVEEHASFVYYRENQQHLKVTFVNCKFKVSSIEKMVNILNFSYPDSYSLHLVIENSIFWNTKIAIGPFHFLVLFSNVIVHKHNSDRFLFIDSHKPGSVWYDFLVRAKRDIKLINFTAYENLKFKKSKSFIHIHTVNIAMSLRFCYFHNVNTSIMIQNKLKRYSFPGINLHLWLESSMLIQDGISTGHRGLYINLTSSNNLLIKAIIIIKNCSFSNHAAEIGAAIYFEMGFYKIFEKGNFKISLLNTAFRNNFAKQLGGSLYYTNLKDVQIILFNCLLYFDHPFSMLFNYESLPKGLLVASFSDISLNNTTITCKSFDSVVIPTLIHIQTTSEEDNSGKNNILSKSFYHKCPFWHYSDIKFIQGLETGDMKFITHCKACVHGMFSMCYSVLVQQNATSLRLEYADDINLSGKGNCLKCPKGGQCNNGVLQAKSNFWGLEIQNQVLFYPCPEKYCCSERIGSSCASINACSLNREGVLCGTCKTGFTLSMFSVNCIPNDKCKAYWIWPFIILAALLYMFWFTLNSKILKLPFQALQFLSRIFRKKTQTFMGSPYVSDNFGYFTIVMYFVQASELMKVHEGVEGRNSQQNLRLVNSFLQSSLNFEISNISYDICPFPWLTMVIKYFLKILFLYGIYLWWLVIFSLILLSRNLNRNYKGRDPIYILFIYGFVEICKYTYSMLAENIFQSLRCIKIVNTNVWFYDGHVNCLSFWQYWYLALVIIYAIPFPLVSIFGLNSLSQGHISYIEYLMACIIPFPFLFKWSLNFILKIIKNQQNIFHPFHVVEPSRNLGSRILVRQHSTRCNILNKTDGDNTKLTAQSKIILESYEGPFKKIGICFYWEGILELKKLILCLTLFISQLQIRLFLSFLFSILVLVFQMKQKPFTNSSSNRTQTVSLCLLVIYAVINLCKINIHQEQAEEVAPNLMFIIERSLLLIIIIFIILNHTMYICMNVIKKQKTTGPSNAIIQY